MSETTQTHPAPAADDLRARILAFRLDEPDSVFPFSARLARENGWSRAYALRVVEEYRRFVYLAMSAGHPVTPSVDVDHAWHLHLTYTRSYWEEMCGRVLGRPLHHDPTRGGRAEGAKFTDWYSRTLRSYQEAFGAAPPADIWPSPAVRFAPAARTRTVSAATHWIIRRPRLRLVHAAPLALAALAGCTLDSPIALVLVVLGVGAAIVAGAATQNESAAKKKRDGSSDGGTSSESSGSSCDSADASCGDGGGDGGGGCGGGCGGCGG